MSQVSYGTITITDTNDIERIYIEYCRSTSNQLDTSVMPPIVPDITVNWSENTPAWQSGEYIWQRSVVKKSGISDLVYGTPVCLTGAGGRSIEEIKTFYCNYGTGTPAEDYDGWSVVVPEYVETKPYYWIKTVIIYVDDSKEERTYTGNPIVLDDAQGEVKNLDVELLPIQDLHGYSKPWSAGAGKNKLQLDSNTITVGDITFTQNTDGSILANGTASEAIIYNIKPNVQNTYALLSDIWDIKADTQYVLAGTPTGYGYPNCYLQLLVYGSGAEPYDAGNGSNPFSFTQSDIENKRYRLTLRVASGTTLNNVTIKPIIRLASDGDNTWVPYSNICPITGHDSVTVIDTGKNIFDGSQIQEWTNRSGMNIVRNNDGSFTMSGTATVTDYQRVYMTLGAGTYTFSGCPAGGSSSTYSVYVDGQGVSGYDTGNGVTFTLTATQQITFVIPRIIMGTNTNGLTFKPQLERGSTKTAYEPYKSQSKTVTLPHTVYGAGVGVTSGESKEKWLTATLDENASVGGFYTGETDVNRITWVPFADVGKLNSPILSDCLQTVTAPANTPWSIGYNISGAPRAFIYVPKTITSMDDFKAYLRDNHIQLVYELATPTDLSTTPTSLTLYNGDNVVSSDGNMTLDYYSIAGRDIQIHLDNGLTEAIAQSVEANSNATEALDKANVANSIAQSANENSQGALSQSEEALQTAIRVDTLLDGHFIYGSALSQSTPGGARVVEQVKEGTTDVSENPGKWHHNVITGSNGIQLRYNEAVMAQIAANQSGNDTALKFYQPPTVNGNTTTQGALTMELSGNALKFFKPTTSYKAMELSGSGLIFYDASAVNGGNIQAQFGNSGAIQSGNYAINAVTDKFSTFGTKIDLTYGEIYSPYFRLSQGSISGGPVAGIYMSGTFESTGALIGYQKISNSDTNAYWKIGYMTDTNQDRLTYQRGNSIGFIELAPSSTFILQKSKLHTAWFGNNGYLTYPYLNNKYYDFGMNLPTSLNDKFLYIRYNTGSNLSTIYQNDSGWTYPFYVDGEGKVHAQNFYIGDSTTPIGGGAGTIAEQIINSDSTYGKGSTTQPIYVDSTGHVQEVGWSSETSLTNSDLKIPTSAAVKSFVEGKGYTTNTGTVTSVQVQASSPLQSSTNTAQTVSLNTTISFANQNKNLVLAGPSTGSTAAPTFRALVAADIPDLSSIYLTSHQSIKTLHNKSLVGTGNVTLSASDVGALPSNTTYVSKISTTVGTHTVVTNASGAVSFNVPTKTSHLTNDSNFATTTYVDTAISGLPEPMIFKGSLGTGGTISTLPTASASNEGYTYKVIEAGTYASQAAKVGDTFISDGSAWVLIPSGDEPSGTVTSIATSSPITGGTITSSGTIGHATSGVGNAVTTAGFYKFKYDTYGHITGVTSVAKADITGLDIPAQDTTYDNASTTTAGLMSAADKSKLDNIQVDSSGHAVAANVAGRWGIDVTFSDTNVAQVGHTNSAITAGDTQAAKITSSVTSTQLAFGDVINFPYVAYDTYGHITSKTNLYFKMPAAPSSTTNATYATYDASEASNTTKITIANKYIPKSIGSAAGDIIYWSASGTPTRLAKGSNGQVLKIANGVPTWGTDNNDNTTYSLSGSLSNHEFTTTLTPSSGNATTSNFTLVAGSNISLTDSGTTITIAATDTNTATAVDNILDGSNSGTAITYAPYNAQQSKLSFDTSTTAPTRTDRLNLNGYLYATKLYSNGKEVLTEHQSLSDYKTKQTPITAPTATTNKWINTLAQNANGEITVTYTSLDTSGTWSGNAVKLGITTVGGTGTPIYLDSGAPKAITSAISVSLGGTGTNSFTSGAALIGNGSGVIQTRSITNQTSGAVTASTNLVTANSLVAHVANITGNYVAKSGDTMTGTLETPELIATKIRADNVVTHLLTAEGIETKNWTATNISTIDGSFYICPTISCSTGTIKYTASGGTLEMTAGSGKSFNINSIFTTNNNAAAWTSSSWVMITGEVLIGTEYCPIGTVRGKITATAPTTSKITIGNLTTNLTDNTSPKIIELMTNGFAHTFRDLKISLYSYYNNNQENLLGIMLTTAGAGNRTYIDIYDGTNQTNGKTSGDFTYTEPKVRIGNLNGLNSYTQAEGAFTVTPKGWGIYTTNGFFVGDVYAENGYIGGFTIDTNVIKKGKTSYDETTNDGVWLGTDGIGLGKGKFYVTDAGVLTAKSGTIGGWSIDADTLKSSNGSVGLKGSGSTSTDIVFWAGNATSSSAPFRVRRDGQFTATSGSIGNNVTIGGTAASQVLSDIMAAQITGDEASYLVEIEVRSIDYIAPTTTLFAHVYYKGIELTSNTTPAISTISFQWKKIIENSGTYTVTDISGAINQTLVTTDLDTTYICVISK